MTTPAGIDMAGFPVIAGNMSELRGHAMMIAVAGTGYIDTGERVHNTWQDLYPHYLAPEAGQLMAATGPVATVCRHVGRNLQQARDALVVYADTVETIQGELELLRNRATDVNTAITAAGPEWRSDHDLVDRGNAVGDAITVAAVAFVDAQRVCVNALRALHGQPALTADDGDGIIDPTTELGYTLDQYRAAAQLDPDDGGGLPWGAVTERDYPWYLDVVSAPLRFVGGLGDAVVNTALGIAALGGYDHATGQTTGATAGTAWTNLGKLALAAGTYIGPGGAIRDQLGTMPGLEPGEAGQILTDTGKALIAYDQWDDDPARAAGNALGNIALAVFGTKGAGAGLRGAGLALQLTHHASLTARTGTVLTRAGEAIARIPTLTELAGSTWRHLHPPDAPAPRPSRTPDDLARPLEDAPTQPIPPRATEAGSVADDVTGSTDRPEPVSERHVSNDPTPSPAGTDAAGGSPSTRGPDLDAPSIEVEGPTRAGTTYTGAGSFDEATADAASARRYDEIRSSSTDVDAIARNTGIDPRTIADVKQHLFETEHDLPIAPNETVRARFTPDERIAELWPAVARGDATPGQISDFERIVAHEYVELRLMQDVGLPYRSAHPAAFTPDVGNRPTADHYGAHDRAPLTNNRRDPFAHYENYGWTAPQSPLGRSLESLDQVVAELKELLQ